MSAEMNTGDSKKPMQYATSSQSTPQTSSLSTDRELLETLRNTCGDFKPSLNLLSEIWDTLRLDIMSRTDKPENPIGLKSLDDILWGMYKKELMVVGARTSQGKSAFSIFLAKNLVDIGKRVIYFSLEMSKEQILERLLTQILLVNNLDLRHGAAKNEVIEREKMFTGWMDNVKLLIDDRYGYDFNKLVSIVELIRPDFVFIDYIQMISTKGFKSKLDAIEEYVRQIKELAVEYNFGAVLISQVNRSGTEGAEMQHLKWAGVLEEHADTVCMLRWDYSANDMSKYIIDVKKQRHGEVRNGITINFIPEHSLFSERPFLNVPKGAKDESFHEDRRFI